MMPPMTLPQAVELINRVRTVQHGMRDLIARGERQDLIEHALSAYKAGILLFEHGVGLEETLAEVTKVLQQIQQAMTDLLNDPDFGPLLRAQIEKMTTQGEDSLSG